MPAIAGTTEPLAFVLSNTDCKLEMANAVVVAFVVVELPVMMKSPFMVVEPTETKPPEKVRVVEVAALGNG